MARPSRRRRFRRYKKLQQRAAPGAPPGTITVDPEAPKPKLHAIAFGAERVVEEAVTDLAALDPLRRGLPVLWLDVVGLGDADVLSRLADRFGIHPLALEDVVHVHQRPKIEDYERNQFLVLRMLEVGGQGATEQISIFLGKDYVLTFQERPGDCFDPLRQRIRSARGRVRRNGPDYLVYALVDAIVDHYFPSLDATGERLLAIEEQVIGGEGGDLLERLYELKRELVGLRRAVLPLREVLSRITRGDVRQITPDTQVFFRDCYDHAFQVLEVIDGARDTASNLMDLYLNRLGQRMNEVMMVLTMVATIFIPLSFVAGLYGMNFDPEASPWNMPELGTRYGYPVVLGVMALVAATMVGLFWRRGWIGGRALRRPGPPG